MNQSFRSEQEAFWAGEFGDAYVQRNQGDAWVASNTALFASVLKRAAKIESAVELGANIGLNLRALRNLMPSCSLTGVEINATAVETLRGIPGLEAVHGSIHDYRPARQFDLSFTKTVLIHISPELLPGVYETLYAASRRYIVLVEYYSPAPVEVSYRGHANRLFKRDFAGEMLDRFPDLRLRDYGFWYRRDPHFQDDVNWFLMEKA